MKIEIKVPAMGESISEATIGEILKESGSQVAADEEILELETDKVNQALYAPENGMVQWSVKQDDVVKIGDVIGHLDTEAASAAPEEKKEPEKKEEPVKREEPVKPSSEGAARETVDAFVEELKEPPKKEAPAAAAPPPPKSLSKPQPSGRETRKRISKMRRVIAERLVGVQQQTAMLTTFNEADMTEVMALRAKQKESFEKKHGVKLGFMSFFVKAVVAALKAVPELNSYIDGDELVMGHYYDISIAVGTDRGLIVPVLRDCDTLSFAEIEQKIAELAQRAREGAITVEELQGGCFTITNGGVYGSLLSTPILNPPQTGILGMHKIQKRPVAIGEEVAVRPMMYLALSYDHCVVDGKEAVTFLVRLKELLEEPSRLLLEV